MAQIAGGETDKRVFLFWGRSTYDDRTPDVSSESVALPPI